MSEPLKIYGGVLTMDEAEHAYTWTAPNKEPIFVPAFSNVVGILNKPALVQWAANMAAEYFREQMTRPEPVDIDLVYRDAKTAHRRASKSASDIGTTVHGFCQRALVEQRVAYPADPQARNGCEAFMTWLHAHEIQPLAVERKVMSKKWWYAGTTDFVGRIDGERCVLDFKTSNPFKNKWNGPYAEMHLQLTAYAIALEEELKCKKISHGWVVRLDKSTGKCEPYKVDINAGTRDCWTRVKELHEQLHKLEERLINGEREAA